MVGMHNATLLKSSPPQTYLKKVLILLMINKASEGEVKDQQSSGKFFSVCFEMYITSYLLLFRAMTAFKTHACICGSPM